jgi:hypothetical protein
MKTNYGLCLAFENNTNYQKITEIISSANKWLHWKSNEKQNETTSSPTTNYIIHKELDHKPNTIYKGNYLIKTN